MNNLPTDRKPRNRGWKGWIQSEQKLNETKPAIYAITPYHPIGTHYGSPVFVMKLGLANKFEKRIDHYATGYPYGFQVYERREST